MGGIYQQLEQAEPELTERHRVIDDFLQDQDVSPFGTLLPDKRQPSVDGEFCFPINVGKKYLLRPHAPGMHSQEYQRVCVLGFLESGKVLVVYDSNDLESLRKEWLIVGDQSY